jgi:hypothetical protein
VTGFRLRFLQTDEPKRVTNRAHLDQHLDLTSTSWPDREAMVARALELGGRHLDVGQLPKEQHVVLADPEGDELCVTEPADAFLAGCGRVGGGPELTWGGPPLPATPGRSRVRFEVAATGGRAAEATRLVALGATVVDDEELTDPDGNEFRLLPG